MSLSLGGSKSKSSQTQNSTSSTSYNPEFTNQLQSYMSSIQGRTYQGLDPNAYKAFESPYQQEVIDAATADINANRAIAQNQLRSTQAGTGAFTNDRRGIAEAEVAGQYDRNLASTVAALRSQGYSQAQGIAQGENQNRNAYQVQQDALVAQLMALLAQGNQTTTSSGTTKGTGSGFGFQAGMKYGGKG